MNFVFDVDGTLTPSRQKMDSEFKDFFLDFCSKNDVYLVTGSDYAKTLEQIGEDVLHAVKGSYNCSGNTLYVKGELQYVNEFVPTDEQIGYLEDLLEISPFRIRTGTHIEMRTGLCNFSVLGRNCTHEERQSYIKYDEESHERKYLSYLIRSRFPELDATVAGDTGLDIHPIGLDKSQIAKDLEPFIFFGDKIQPGGNDYTISLLAKKAHSVTSWVDTYYILNHY